VKQKKMDHIAPLIKLFGITFDLSIILMLVVTCTVVFVLAKLGTRNASVTNPSKMQNFVEWIVEFVENIIGSSMEKKQGKPFLMLGITLLMFIFVGNMLGLPFAVVTEHEHPAAIFGQEFVSQETLNEGLAVAEKKGEPYHGASVLWWKSPTANSSVTMGLAAIVIFLSHFLGIFRNPRGYFKHYVEPNVAFLPIHLIEQVSKLLTLGLRLFGNIFAGEVMIAVILGLGIWGIPALLVWQGFSIFVGSIQAYIFVMLTMVYISQVMPHDEKH
jgi:F-type H+-transporting ATPase subunit a